MARPARPHGLTPKQARFVDEYLVDLNGTRAAIRAGYSARTARSCASENLAKPNIQAAIASRMRARAERIQIEQDRVLKELARIAFFDIRTLYRADGSLRAIRELDDDAAAVLVGYEVTDSREYGEARVTKIRLPDKIAALTLAMRHLGMLRDRVEHTGKDGGPISTESASRFDELTNEQLMAIAAGYDPTGGRR